MEWIVESGLLTLHLAAVNGAAALPLLAVMLMILARRLQLPGASVASRMARMANLAMVGGLLTGLMLGGWLWLQSDPLIALLPRFRWKIGWGIAEVIFYFVCMFGSIACLRSPEGSRWRPATGGILLLLAATNLLYHFPPLFYVMSRVAEGGVEAPQYVRPSDFRRLVLSGPVVPLTVHFWLASLAFAASWMAQTAGGTLWRGAAASEPTIVRLGSRIALAATGLQLPVGLWLLVRLDGLTQQRLIGGDAAATALLLASLVAAFGLLHRLASDAFGDVQDARRQARRTFLLMLLVVLLMTAMLRRVQRLERDARVTSIPPAVCPLC